MNQITIAKDITIEGIGIHHNKYVKIIIKKREVDGGILFYKMYKDYKVEIELNSFNILNTELASVIGIEKNNKTHQIFTIEHMLSAISSYKIDNLNIYVYGDEIPILDGSAILFMDKIEKAGILEQNKPKKYMKIKKIIRVEYKDSFASFEPDSKFKFDVKINFNHIKIGEQSYQYMLSTKSFKEEIAIARTFGFLSDIEKLQKNGLALGANLNNAIGLTDNDIKNKNGLRIDKEFVKHKLLDAIGDTRILNGNIIGKYSSYKAGHKLNSDLRLKVLSSPKNFTIE